MNTSEIIILCIGLALLLGLIFLFNRFVMLRNKVDEAFSTMDVCLRKRFDLVPRMAEVVKGYAQYEAETLEKIVRARVEISDMSLRMKLEAGIGRALGNAVVAAEAYPDLKASENFLNLQHELSRIEEDIASARRYYNGSVREYNTLVESFPANCMAKLLHYKRREMFVMDDLPGVSQ